MFLENKNRVLHKRITDYFRERYDTQAPNGTSTDQREFADPTEFWRQKLKTHFPAFYNSYAETTNADFKALYQTAYENDYIVQEIDPVSCKIVSSRSFTKDEMNLFTAIKDGDVRWLEAYKKKYGIEKLKQALLTTCDINGLSGLMWAGFCVHQLVKNFVYRTLSDSVVVKSENIDIFNFAHLAAMLNQPEAEFEALAELDVDMTVVIDRIGSPIQIAIQFKHHDAYAALKNRCATVRSTEGTLDPDLVNAAVIFGNTPVLREFIQQGLDVNMQLEGFPLIMHACFTNQLPVVDELIKAGADVNRREKLKYSNNGSTALHCVAEFGRVQACRLLLDAGADITLKNEHGITALEIAQANRHQQIVDLLNQHAHKPTPQAPTPQAPDAAPQAPDATPQAPDAAPSATVGLGRRR